MREWEAGGAHLELAVQVADDAQLLPRRHVEADHLRERGCVWGGGEEGQLGTRSLQRVRAARAQEGSDGVMAG